MTFKRIFTFCNYVTLLRVQDNEMRLPLIIYNEKLCGLLTSNINFVIWLQHFIVAVCQ